jgi:signal recognition particle receptor subunit beta
MAEVNAERAEVHARIVYWGAEGAGKTANLRHVWRKLRSDHRGELRSVPTALDPSVAYEILPITLGEISGHAVQLQVIAVPGGAEHALTRKQLLDRVDGVVLVVDARRDRLEANLDAFDELRRSIGAYGRPLEDLPLVIQYNQRDRADDLTLEELHKKLDLRGAPVFEAVASEGKGVLQALTTISKLVIRHLRDGGLEGVATPAPAREHAAKPAAPPPPPATQPSFAPPRPAPERAHHAVERGLAEEARDPARAARVAETAVQAAALFSESWGDVTAEITLPGSAEAPPTALELEDPAPPALVAVGRARQTGEHSLAVPVTLRDAGGREFSLSLRIKLDVGLGPAEED